jgi:hypothetical protein
VRVRERERAREGKMSLLENYMGVEFRKDEMFTSLKYKQKDFWRAC